MGNDNFRIMMASLLPLDEPMRRKRPHKQPKQAKTWKRNRQAQRDYISRLNTEWKGENS